MRAGYSGAGPASVEGQSGQTARVVDYVDEAWQEIQRSRPNWKFMRRRFSGQTQPGINTVALPDSKRVAGDLIRSVDENSWFTRAPSDTTGGVLRYVDSDQRRWLEENEGVTTGRPAYFWETATDIRVSPTPDRAYQISGDYYVTAQSFASSDSAANKTRSLGQRSPDMPEQYHMAIVWLAVREIGGFEGDGNVFNLGDANYRKIFNQMLRTETPSIGFGPPLA